VIVPALPELLVATTNIGKLLEIRKILSNIPFRINSLEDYTALAEPEEDGSTFAENARKKALYYAHATKTLTAADDSGLEIDALGGRPGIRSSRYHGDTYSKRFDNLYKELETLHGTRGSTARFVCSVALVWQGHVIFTADGTVEGRVAPVPTGTGGFGYDPLFYYPPLDVTLAELTSEQKMAASHRGKAFRALRTYLQNWTKISNLDFVKG
jgi:XTP/dITP diphosphohydrolase